ncbi:lysozyme inhibitor LprI family protein [Pseudomonas rubra]|uniref:Lysozyme inhibitor LprI family protein n=1 Tax=Pseudomonas rubra TaxID=2942627 RepID=A0ABT5PG08_9PSED|nr:lysozyme inhibitor LprI family protein [Pseudomonas rubra]MDD1017240.1 lysozyme inhibitor LprI family protein [Pseudomonas rubra]MDD1041715.1 lysozyme inhibitor LprI family protein [Pseudomonas rubra]MDD1156802.1 lysozyme inhibitor LprI family protein [Pseudomonas rubra]
MKRPFLAIGLLLCCSSIAQAQDDYSPDYTACMKTAESTLAMNNCNGAEIKHQDSRLNSAYKKAMAGLEGPQQAQLREAQRAWIKYRDANCKLYYSLTGGTIDQLNGAGCLLSSTKARADELQALLEP